MRKATSNYISDPYQQVIYKSRYARWVEKEGRREEWPETVARYFDFFAEFLQAKYKFDIGPMRRELEEMVLQRGVMPSMRGMMTAGAALKRDEGAIYNCSFLPIDNFRAFDELLYCLSLGTGVGFSVESADIDNLPALPEEFFDTDTVIVFEDSRLGWAKGFREYLSLLMNGNMARYDVSKIRARGARLKTFGGRASGPGPLVELLDFSKRLFKGAAGRKLNTLECHDLACKVGEVIVAGGVRRSALISLSDLGDSRMRDAKSGAWWKTSPHRRLSNNSAVYTEVPDISIFLDEWAALYRSKSGERGIFNRKAARRVVDNANEFRKTHFGDAARLRDKAHEFGANPCVPYNTRILTRNGYVKIGEVTDKTVDIWNGEEWSQVTPKCTGVSRLVRVLLSDGSSLVCTPYHRWCVQDEGFVEAKDMVKGTRLQKFDMPVVMGGTDLDIDPYSQGFYSADGNTDYDWSFVYEPKYEVIGALTGTISEKESWGRKRWKHGRMFAKNFVPHGCSVEFRLRWLAGLLDGDGTKALSDKKCDSYSIQWSSIDREFVEETRLMLTTLGVRGKISMSSEERAWGEYQCKPVYRMCISTSDVRRLIDLGLKCERIKLTKFEVNRDARRFVTVSSVEDLGDSEEAVYCFNEPKGHRGTFEGIVTGQCSEIILRPYEFCNLTSVQIYPSDTFETLREKVRVATIIGTLQSCLTNFKYLNKRWQKNCEDERLLGVSLNGVYDNALTNGSLGHAKLAEALEGLKIEAIRTNMEIAAKLGINASVAITCVKPEGTLSQLNGTSSGIHPAHSPYYIRHVRNDAKDPLTQFLIESGVPHEVDHYDPGNTICFKFPVKAPEGAVLRDKVTAIEHLELWKLYQVHYCEHKPSITVSVREDEWLDVGAWCYRNFDWLSGVSFLPADEGKHIYTQAPFQECTRAEYEALQVDTPSFIDWEALADFEHEDATTSSQELACSGGSCELVALS